VVALGSLAGATAALVGAGAALGSAGGRASTSITPASLLSYNLQIAAIAPVSGLIQRAVFGVEPRYLTSVTGRFRWRWAAQVAAGFAPVWTAYVTVDRLLRPAGDARAGGARRLDATALALAAVVLTTTPLQAAGEEYAFRGLIQRSTGSWLARGDAAFAASTLLTAVPFALIHLAKDPWVAAYHLLSGVAFSTMTRSSGGLEAAVVVHAVGNTALLLPVVTTARADALLDPASGPTGRALLAPMAIMVATALAVRWAARRHDTTTAAAPPPARGGDHPGT